MQKKLTMLYPSAWHGQMWREAAPCGNGLVGASVYGGVKKEIILLNHAYLWRSGKTMPLPDVSVCLADIRARLRENRPDLADGILAAAFREKGYAPEISLPLPLGDIEICSASNAVFYDYRREIDLEQAEVTVSWREDALLYRRSVFVSRANGLAFVRIVCSRPALDIAVSLCPHAGEESDAYAFSGLDIRVDGPRILYAAENKSDFSGGDFGAVLQVHTAGNVHSLGNRLRITDTDEMLLVTRTFAASDRETEFARPPEPHYEYDAELQAHRALHGALYGRVDFSLSDTHRPNELLLMEAFTAKASCELIEKLYAYGRYLFVCSTSDGGTLPCHLAGLWNGAYECFWAFHMFNVNFQMIYWQALPGNLPGYLRLALDYVFGLIGDFQENAKKMFGCRGICINSVNTPESGLAKITCNHILNWTAGAAWVSQQFWEYYLYTGDLEYLRRKSLPFMAQAALFYEDFLTEGEDGRYVFSPSVSPENTAANVLAAFGREIETCVNATMDIAVVKELLGNLLKGCALTGMYEDKLDTWRGMLAKLPPYRANGQNAIQEWTDDFYQDHYHHRHHSHLYPVFPGHEVAPGHPLYPAFVQAEELRLRHGLSDQSSWSMVFMACIAARMCDGERALHLLQTMAKTCLMNNLFTVHNDWRRMGPVGCADFRNAPFQIDANIGFCTAIHEMLLQADGDTISVLPALPAEWEHGKMEGLLLPGGIVCSLVWQKDGVWLHIDQPAEVTRRIRHNQDIREVSCTQKQVIYWRR